MCASSSSWWANGPPGSRSAARRPSSGRAHGARTGAHSSSLKTAMATQRSSPRAGVDAVRGGVGVLEPVAGRVSRRGGWRAPFTETSSRIGAEQADAGLDRRHVDFGALAGVAASADRHQQRGRVEEGGLVVHVGQPPAGGLAPRQAADVATCRRPPAPRDRSCGNLRAGRSGQSRSSARRSRRGAAFEVRRRSGPSAPSRPARSSRSPRSTRRISPSASSRPGGAHVDGDAQLVAVVVVEQATLVGVGVGVLLAVGARLALVDRQPARHVESLAVLDPDDLGAEVGQQAGGARSRRPSSRSRSPGYPTGGRCAHGAPGRPPFWSIQDSRCQSFLTPPDEPAVQPAIATATPAGPPAEKSRCRADQLTSRLFIMRKGLKGLIRFSPARCLTATSG